MRVHRSPRLDLGYTGVAAAAVVGGFGVAAITRILDTQPAITLALALASAMAVLALASFVVFFGPGVRSWFHPVAFPLLYISEILMLPVLYVALAHREIGQIAERDISPTLINVFALTVLGFLIGVKLWTRRGVNRQTDQNSVRFGIDYTRLLTVGRFALVLVTLLRIARLPVALGRPYGAGSVVYTLSTALLAFEDVLIFIAVVLVVVANTQLSGTVFRSFDLTMFLGFALASLAIGSRGELVAPCLFALWAHHTYIRPISFSKGLLLSFAVVVLFAFVGAYRSSGREIVGVTRESLLQKAFVSVSTPVFTTSEVVARVPREHEFKRGSTYLEAIIRQLPGPISRALFGPPRTGTYVFRELIGFRNPNAGFGFSFPSEAYLNFGVAGTFIASVFAGGLFGFAYVHQSDRPSRALHVLYGLLISTLPYNLRSDALSQVKIVLYPAIVLALLFARSRFSRSLAPLQPSEEVELAK